MLRIIAGTLAYLIVTFPLAYVWHLVLFQQTYQELGYIGRDEPIIAFGFTAILLQGVILSALYPKICAGMPLFRGVVTFALLMGGYHWTMHVLAAAAKHSIAPLSTWFLLETTYLVLQFSLGTLVFALIHRQFGANEAKLSQE
ncbi:hypothetical protein Pan97_42130 [Bremerella volcania]|uniref:Uncharacterized protein n=1 Tax=Bremerella volcania TaxID=2527984 RepID=A0A518CD50_9BACT|nr:hypothetical protein [Bremerella volcania]QDU77151.1 hypothetical protein Pan97_42130 [Bremerella volcania]